MDSCDYVCAFDIKGADDAPEDFELPPNASKTMAGVFLPQGESDWLGGRKYPARMLLVTEEELWVIPHAAAGGRPVRILLRDLETLECGRMLLLGWIGLHTESVVQTLEYNQRSCVVVDRFIAGLKARWLRREPGVGRLPRQAFGAALDQKFDSTWSFEAIDKRGRTHFLPLGAMRLSSSNQFWTRIISVTGVGFSSSSLTIRKHWPSEEIS
jgi:hypothetical protein